jgi:upstream activation factor subunit UAF30
LLLRSLRAVGEQFAIQTIAYALLKDCAERGCRARRKRILRVKTLRFPYEKALTSGFSLGILLPPCRASGKAKQQTAKTAITSSQLLRRIPMAAKKKASKKAPAKKKAAKRKPNAAFMKPMKVSADLGAVIGNSAMPRTEVTKKIWAYIKKNGLQDSKNKRNINADDKLKPIFGGKKQVSMFEMTKLVSKHLS